MNNKIYIIYNDEILSTGEKVINNNYFDNEKEKNNFVEKLKKQNIQFWEA